MTATALAVAMPAMAASTFVDPRLPNEQELADATRALHAFLPTSPGTYRVIEIGHYEYRPGKYVVFSAPFSEAADPLSRTKRVTCSNQGQTWNCRGPSTFVNIHGSSFLAPENIDDKTIMEIVDYTNSPCLSEQVGKLTSARPFTASRQITALSKVAEEYRISLGTSSSVSIVTAVSRPEPWST
ncbi:MAG: hypothetical protein ACREUW_20585, partial [Burkholderiales bacterium]